MEQNKFLETLMVLPVKPEFIGFTVNTETLYNQLVPIVNEIAGHDISSVCDWSCDNQDYEFWFTIDTDELANLLGDEEYFKVWESFPFDPDSSWEVAQTLLEKLYKLESTGSWAIANVRSWDSSTTEVQIGIPRNL